MKKVLQRIKVTVREPFSGGTLIVKAGGKQILPPIYLAGVREPNYENVCQDVIDYDKAHRQKGGYIWLSDELLPIVCVPIEEECSPEVIGEPKENVETEFTYYRIAD